MYIIQSIVDTFNASVNFMASKFELLVTKSIMDIVLFTKLLILWIWSKFFRKKPRDRSYLLMFMVKMKYPFSSLFICICLNHGWTNSSMKFQNVKYLREVGGRSGDKHFEMNCSCAYLKRRYYHGISLERLSWFCSSCRYSHYLFTVGVVKAKEGRFVCGLC
jgi:hypothetical protein